MTRIGFVVEQGLGHRSHYSAMQRATSRRNDVDAVWMPIEPSDVERVWAPFLGKRRHFPLKASLAARRALALSIRDGRLDAALVHTETLALFAAPLMRRVPTAISIDATPAIYAELAAAYGHRVHSDWKERVRALWLGRAFRAAAAVVSMSEWARRSVIEDYGVERSRAHVIPPAVDTEAWCPAPRADGGPLRILFVGGDFARKGGDVLLRWAARTAKTDFELHLVTRDPVPDTKHVFVHRHEGGCRELIRLVQSCHVFALPTRGDCSPIACVEAMAAGLAVVVTRVGGTSELVEDGETGFVVERGDERAVGRRLDQLVCDRALSERMGAAARIRALARHSAETNFGTLLDLLRAA